jgi:hypothetical protein
MIAFIANLSSHPLTFLPDFVEFGTVNKKE